MISETLKKARDYEAKHMSDVSSEERPLFHVTAPIGWLNDPNGFSFYKGQFHLFFQYHPFSSHWGPMHWGHVASSDLLTWNALPCAIAPDEVYDNFGCFSGSGIALPDGRHMLMYTGVQTKDGFKDRSDMEQQQCIAFGDGIDYEKYEHNPVIRMADVTDGIGGIKTDFRDPKIWQEADGTFYTVAAGMDPEGNGRALLFKSSDALNWTFESELSASHGKLGRMWECPDFYELDGKYILAVSLMNVHPDGMFHVGHNTAYMIGTFDHADGKFVSEMIRPLDEGIDFYAPQSVLAPDGRRIMISWMQCWSNASFIPDDVKIFGQMSIPREVFLRDGMLWQRPIREIESHRGSCVTYKNVCVEGEKTFDGISGRVLDMTLLIRPEEAKKLMIKVAADERYDTQILYYPQKNVLRLDRSNGGFDVDMVHTRNIPVETVDGCLKLRILMDRYSAEIFVNDGRHTATVLYPTPLSAEDIIFEADGRCTVDIEKYDLQF